MVLFSPKLLLTDKTWRDMLQSPVYKEHLVGFIVDEAYCVKKWQLCNTLTSLKVSCLSKLLPVPYRGNHFRREFSNLCEVRSLLCHDVNIMALTATATRMTRKQICHVLGMSKTTVVAESLKTNIILIFHIA